MLRRFVLRPTAQIRRFQRCRYLLAACTLEQATSIGLLRDDGSLFGSHAVLKKGFQRRRVRTSRGAGRRLLS